MQGALFYSFRIEDHVPGDHLLRSIDLFFDLSSIRKHLKPFYSATGRPSIDPELMIRMLVIGYCMGIRSERRLCEEVHLNLAYRWFCRLDLDGLVPDHSTFSKNRHGGFRDSDLLRKLFELTQHVWPPSLRCIFTRWGFCALMNALPLQPADVPTRHSAIRSSYASIGHWLTDCLRMRISGKGQ